jgi:hypothetical protein
LLNVAIPVTALLGFVPRNGPWLGDGGMRIESVTLLFALVTRFPN